MSKTWTFIGGMLAGVASVFAAAAAVELKNRTSHNSDAVEKKEKLALPEGSQPASSDG